MWCALCVYVCVHVCVWEGVCLGTQFGALVPIFQFCLSHTHTSIAILTCSVLVGREELFLKL